jgi:hypothetical protein
MYTLDDFKQFIAQYKKEKGGYTISELNEIGARYREARKDGLSGFSWQDLYNYLGVYGMTVNAYQKRVERYISSLNCADEGTEFANNFTEKQKIRDWYNAYRRDLRDETRIQNFKDEIAAAAEKFKKLTPIVYDSSEEPGEKEAILLLSDLHIGVDCDNFYNKYDVDVARERLNTLLSRTIGFCLLNEVNTLHVFNMGDMIHGVIHTNARIEQQMDVAEQVIVAGELISSFLNSLTIAAPIVTYRSVYDNHSRVIANKNEHIEKEQFSRVIDWFIKERLKDTSIKFVENDIDGGIGSLTLQNGKEVMFSHGHQDGRNNSMQNFIGLTRKWVDYICLAHYHSAAVKEFQGCKVFINGSIVGTEQYAFGKRLFSKPSQKLLIFDKSDTVQDIDIAL